MKDYSFCVHSYNEGAALRRLIMSSLPLADLVREWVVVNHRSADDTAAVCDELKPILAARGVHLRTLYEERDLSPAFTFADLRDATIRACDSPLVVLHDADFILGPGFRGFLTSARVPLRLEHCRFHGAAFVVPIIWDHLAIDDQGVIQDHGRIWVHQRRARILVRDAVRYTQTKGGGRWEELRPTPTRRRVMHLTGKRHDPVPPDTVISVNVKPADRLALRDTMTFYMEDAVQGRIQAPWLEAYRAGVARSQGTYDYQNVSVKGWRLHSGAVTL